MIDKSTLVREMHMLRATIGKLDAAKEALESIGPYTGLGGWFWMRVEDLMLKIERLREFLCQDLAHCEGELSPKERGRCSVTE